MRDESPQFKSVTYSGLDAGPRLVVTGAVHGNETCGTRAIGRVMEALDAQRLSIAAGSVTFVPVTNPLAYAKGERAGDRNLNRNLAPTAHPVDARYGIGTTEFMRAARGYAVTVECGQHDDPRSPQVAWRAIVNALAFLGLVRSAPVTANVDGFVVFPDASAQPGHEWFYLARARAPSDLLSID